MKNVVSFLVMFTFSLGVFAQEYVQTTTNSAFANKSFSTSGKVSIGLSGAEATGGSYLNLKSNWGNWMALIDGYSDDVYAFHNPNNGGRMELFIHDGETDTNNFGVFTIKKDGNIGIGTAAPLGKLHVNGSIRGNIDGGALRVQSDSGYLDLGSRNSSWAHIYTDRPKIIFNKDVYTTSNAFSSYNNDLILKTKGAERLRIDDVSGNAVFTNNIESKGTVNGKRGVFDASSLGDDGWIPVSIGREHEPERRTFEFVVAPTDTGSGYTAFAITDQSGVLRHDFVSNNTSTWIDLDNHNDKHFFKVASGDDLTYIHMPLPKSRIVIGQYGGYLADEGHNLVVKGGSALVEDDLFTTGNIGIGTKDTKGYELAVNGKIHTKEVAVDLDGWADYVFEANYNLPSLQQVENHITEKGHLMNIPSAAEVAEKGIQLGEMNAKLLEKIEELTLYTIDQEKQLKAQKAKNEAQEARLAKLEALLIN